MTCFYTVTQTSSQFCDTLPLERIEEAEESRKNSQAVLSHVSRVNELHL
jgi:hypothetical protein